LIGLKSFDVHLHEADKRAAVIGSLTAAAIDDDTYADDLPSVGADDIDGFLDATAASDHILGDDEALVRPNLETAPQHQTAFMFLGKDVAFPEGAAHFLADDDAAQGRGNDSVALDASEFIRELAANLGCDVGMLEKQGTLEKLPAVQAGAQDEMPVKQRAGFSEEREQILAHFVGRFCETPSLSASDTDALQERVFIYPDVSLAVLALVE
jgi:hypothetical protein